MENRIKSMTLKRVANNDYGTFGVLIDNNIAFALTLEPKWLNNVSFVSCIPAGIYECERYYSPKQGVTFKVKNVPNRKGILFHKLNVAEETEGCIGVGEKFDYLGDKVAILESKHGFNEFMNRLEGEDKLLLYIIWT